MPARPMSTSPSPAAHAAAHARAATADDAACSQDLEEVVAAGLQTCSANVCMTHMCTAARSHTHHANAGLTTGRAAFAETPAKGHSRFCDLFHAAQASCKQRQMPCIYAFRFSFCAQDNAARATSTTMQLHAASVGSARHHEQHTKVAAKGESHSGTRVGGGGIHMKATAAGGAARWWRLQVEARCWQWWAAAAAVTVSAVTTGLGMAVAVRRRAGGGGGRRHGRRRLGRSALLRSDPFVRTPSSGPLASDHPFVWTPGLFYLAPIIKHAWANHPPADGRKARRVNILAHFWIS